MTLEDYEALRPFCVTEHQKRRLAAIIECGGSVKDAAEKLGEKYDAFYSSLRLIKRKASTKGLAPEHDMNHAVPEDYVAKRVSTLYKDGKVLMQWVIGEMDREKLNTLLEDSARAFMEDLPKSPPVPPRDLRLVRNIDEYNDLLNLYTITDYHLGMMAWSEDSGVEWNVDLAMAVFYTAIDDLMSSSPDAAHGVLNFLGDFFHSDGPIPVTPRSGHPLDQGSKYHYTVRMGIKLIRYAVKRALEKHDKVTLLISQGNHDPSTSIVLQEMFMVYYEEENRMRINSEVRGGEKASTVQVIENAAVFYAMQHGKTMLAFHHGHRIKPERMHAAVSSRFRAMWGETVYCYGHMGHLHHKMVKEQPGIIIEQHQTLAPNDAHSANSGYLAERSATAITYSKVSGERSRVVIRPRAPEIVRDLTVL